MSDVLVTVAEVEKLVSALAQTVRREGGEPGDSLYSWRCEHPDRYGPCRCVEDAAAELAQAVRDWLRNEVAG